MIGRSRRIHAVVGNCSLRCSTSCVHSVIRIALQKSRNPVTTESTHCRADSIAFLASSLTLFPRVSLQQDRESHFTDFFSKGLHLAPVSKLDIGLWVRRSLGDPHDHSNHQAIPYLVLLIIDLTGEYCQFSRLPGYLRQELIQVGIGVGSILLWFSSHQTDCEKSVWLVIQYCEILINKRIDFGAVLSIPATSSML